MCKKILIITFIISLVSGYLYHGYSNQNENTTTKKFILSSELKKLIDTKNKDYLLIDVRTEREYKSGHIPTAILIPYNEIQNHTNKIPKDKMIIVYCRTGRRSGIAKNKLIELGYKNVINFGGISDWDYELVK